MIVELRTYTMKPLRAPEFLALYEQLALPLQRKYLGNPIGFFVTEVGPLNQVVHLWAFGSLAERERRRHELEGDPGWAVYRQRLRELDPLDHQESKLLKPVAFATQA